MKNDRGSVSIGLTPSVEHLSSTRSGSFADHEPGLWRAVITQALMDAASQSRKPDLKRARRDALEWLLTRSSDFETVCDHAGMDPDYVRHKARQALERGCSWRLPAGQGWRTQSRLNNPPSSSLLN